MDRVTGQPLVGRRVTLHLEGTLTDRDYRRRQRTDKEGYFHFPVSSSRYLFQVVRGLSADVDGYEYEYGNDQYYRDVQSNMVAKPDSKHLEIIMTDRPIYRLGDTVRFSCVAYKEKNSGEAWEKRLKPASKVKLLATFGDTDYDAKDTLFLTTDKHGRCWGEFVIPPDGKNGTYSLRVVEPDALLQGGGGGLQGAAFCRDALHHRRRGRRHGFCAPFRPAYHRLWCRHELQRCTHDGGKGEVGSVVRADGRPMAEYLHS